MDWKALEREYKKGNVQVVRRLLEAVIFESRFQQRSLDVYGKVRG